MISEPDHARHIRSIAKFSTFLERSFGTEDAVAERLFVPGTRPLRAFRQKYNRFLYGQNWDDSGSGVAYEEVLYSRILEPGAFNLTIIFGGLGAGKSTSLRHLCTTLAANRVGIVSACKCAGKTACTRAPLTVDYREFTAEWAKQQREQEVVPELLRYMRLQVFRRLLQEWLTWNGIDPAEIWAVDRDYTTLRRLLIANDVVNLETPDHPRVMTFDEPRLAVGRLLEKRMSKSEILDMVAQHESAAKAYEQKLVGLIVQDDNARRFSALALQLYGTACTERNPLSLVVLDNLDGLPSEIINRFVADDLYYVATRAKDLPIAVPVRPSSLRVTSRVKDLHPIAHHGPSNFRLVLKRIEDLLLKRPRHELLQVRANDVLEGVDRKHLPFATEPVEWELDALLASAYIYAKVMSAGIDFGLPNGVTGIALHDSHKWLLRIDVSFATLSTLAETVDALVGVCCRYSIELASRFIQNTHSSAHFAGVFRELSKNRETAGNVRLRYRDLVLCLLKNPHQDAAPAHTENLFTVPTGIESTHPKAPSLAKLRIIESLVRKRSCTVAQLVRDLAAYGIPESVTVAAINSLQDKFRLLVWLSTNLPLDASSKDYSKEEVQISEHGDSYFWRLIGNFEYVWFCARVFEAPRLSDETVRFSTKVRGYVNLIVSLGDYEWKQIAFERMSLESTQTSTGAGSTHQMVVLDVLYSTMRTAFRSLRSVLTSVDDDEAQGEFNAQIKSVCELVQLWQRRYEIAYGGRGYLDVYQPEISDIRDEAIRELGNSKSMMDETAKAAINTVLAHWDAIETDASPAPDGTQPFPKASFLSELTRSAPTAAQATLRGEYQQEYVRTRDACARFLSSRLPSYPDVRLVVSELQRAISRVLDHDVPRSSDLARRYIQDQSALDRIWSSLDMSSFRRPGAVSDEEMTLTKRKYNGLLGAVRQLATFLEVRDQQHLGTEFWD